MTASPTAVPRPETAPDGVATSRRPGPTPRSRRVRTLSGTDKIFVSFMVAVPTLFVLALVWFPALASVALSFTNWNGIGSLSKIQGIGFTNYVNVALAVPVDFPAVTLRRAA